MKKNNKQKSSIPTCSPDSTTPNCSTSPANRLRWTISQLIEIVRTKHQN